MTRHVVTRIEPKHAEAWLAGHYRPPQRARCRLAFAAKLLAAIAVAAILVATPLLIAIGIAVVFDPSP